jgi:hypothetical protein
MPEFVCDIPGGAFGQNALLRKVDVMPRRLVADFIIAAHGHVHQADMLTFDETMYTSVFPNLTLLSV